MTKARIIAMVLAAAAGGSIAAVEGQPGAQSTPGTGTGQSVLILKSDANLSGPEKVARAEAIAERAAGISSRIQGQLSEARRQKDIVRVNCLNRKLTEVNAASATLQGRIRSLRDAVNSDEDRAKHEYTVISVMSEKLQQLEQEASQCLGQDSYETGVAAVVTTVDPGTNEEGDVSTAPDSPDIQGPAIPPPVTTTL